MQQNIVRQSLIAAFLTLLIAAAAILTRAGINPPGNSAEIESLLGSYVTLFQAEHPYLMRLAGTLLLFATGVALGRTTVRYALYGVNTYIAIPLFGFAACGVVLTPNYGVACLTVFVAMLAVRKLYASLRNGYAFDALFASGFCFGLLPLIHITTLPLVMLFPLGIILFKRSLRECSVALFGLCLPLLTYCYIVWAMGDEFLTPIRTLSDTFIQKSGFDLRTLLLPQQIVHASMILGLAIAAIYCYTLQRHAMGMKQRAILLFNICFFLLASLLPLAPCSSAIETALWAIPSATLIPLLFVRLPAWIANLIYLLLIAGAVTVLIG